MHSKKVESCLCESAIRVQRPTRKVLIYANHSGQALTLDLC